MFDSTVARNDYARFLSLERRSQSIRSSDEELDAPHAAFWNKVVVRLHCSQCNQYLSGRGMKAILLADHTVELFSTDVPPNKFAELIGDDYRTDSCRCKIRDVACLGCGNIVGYHVTQPCHRCLRACNNGHFWMFFSKEVSSEERYEPNSGKPLSWGNLPPGDERDWELAQISQPFPIIGR